MFKCDEQDCMTIIDKKVMDTHMSPYLVGYTGKLICKNLIYHAD